MAGKRLDKFSWGLIGVFVFALVLRLIHIQQISSAPFFELLLGDSQSFDEWAQQIAAGDWVGKGVFYQAPLYPYFLGVIYTILGKSVMVVCVCQAVIGASSCVLLALAGRNFFSKTVGILAGLILAAYAPAIFFDGLVHKPVLAMLFLCLALWLLSKLIDKPDKRRLWLWLGLVLGCMTLVRENALIFVLGILFWLVIYYKDMGKRCLIYALLFLSGLSVMLLPVIVRNKIVGGEFHLTTSNFGHNFYIGNNENATGLYRPMQFGRGHIQYEQEDDVKLAEQATGREMTPGEISRYWAGRAFEYIKTHPAEWMRLTVGKFFLTWSSIEIGDSEDMYTYAEYSTVLRMSGYVFHFGVLAPIGILGILVTWQERKKLWVLYLLMLIYAVSVTMFFVFARFRYPLVPILILFCSAGLIGIRDFCNRHSGAQIIGCIAIIGLSAKFCNQPVLSKDSQKAGTYLNVGNALQTQGSVDEALGYYYKMLALYPESAQGHNCIGVAFMAKGELNKAIHHFQESLRIRPDHVNASRNLADVLELQKAGER